MLTGLGNQSRHTLLGLHCGFCEKKQAKWDRRFRIRQFKSCWGLQSGTWVTGAEEYRGSFKEVYSECGYPLDGKGSHRGLVLGKSYLTNQQGLRCHNTRDTENELICESGMPRHCPVLTVQATDPRKCSTWTPAPETLNQDVWGSA